MQLTGFDGKIALVSGAGGGIGAAMVSRLLQAGAIVIATDRDCPALDPHPRLFATVMAITGRSIWVSRSRVCWPLAW